MEDSDVLPRFESALVIPRSPTESEQVLAVQQAKAAAPEAVRNRETSRTAFAHLDAVDARKNDVRAFPALVNERSGGTPVLPKGERITRYVAPNVARLSISRRTRGVIESVGPMAKRTASGDFEPIDLGLEHAGSAFEPASPSVAVRIPEHVRDGISARTSGVTLTPTDAAGRALGGAEGSVQGASVVYANTQTDTDTLAKPTSIGFELSAILRSQDSPHALHYRLGLPHGAHLVQHGANGPVQVVSAGALLGIVLPPTAKDSTGAAVPVSMKLEGHMLNLQVEDAPGSFQYPLEVDPEYAATAEDESLTGAVPPEEFHAGNTNWVPFHSGSFSEENTYKEKTYNCNEYYCSQGWYIQPSTSYNAGEFAGLQYKTQGESTVYKLEMWVQGENMPSQTTTQVEYNYGPNGEGQNNHMVLSGGEQQSRYYYEPLSITSGYLNEPLETPRNNDVRIVDYTTKHEVANGFWTFISRARVYVAQGESQHPEVTPTGRCPQCGFNTSSPTIAGAGNRTNALYGSGSWLGPYQGAYEVTAHDPGVGLSFVALTPQGSGSKQRWIRNKEHKCAGIQCPETYTSPETYNSMMSDGENYVELYAEDSVGMIDITYQTVKVDSKAPTSLGFTGMPEEGAEISAAPHTLTVHATDGKAPTASSGVKSIVASIDGLSPTTVAAGSCTPGPCTASGQYTLNAEALSEGVHSLTITASDNAGNIAAQEYSFDVRHASPVTLGPGSVDPTTGQLTLSANDVSLGGASGLERSYKSRNVNRTEAGPLGAQWAMSVGGGQGLRVLPNGDVVLVSSAGGTTAFVLKNGELIAPKGDESLKLEYKSSEHKYVLKDATAGSETVFEQPAATQSVAPSYSNSFGAQAGILNYPVSDAIDLSGNVWVTESGNNRIAKFSKTGALLATYGSLGSEAGQLSDPFGIAIDPRNGNVYVTEKANNRVEEFSSSGAFIRMFGWGVSNGHAEFQICTSSCQAGIAGSGNGQFSVLAGVSVDSSGNVWVADFGNNRVQEFSETGSYLKKFGSVGSGEGQFKGPIGIAFSAGSVFVTDFNNNRVEKFSTAGAFQGQFGESGSENRKFSGPYGIASDPQTGNLYVVDSGNRRVQEVAATGSFAFIAKFGTSGSGPGQFTTPSGVAVDPSGNIFVADNATNSVQEWTRATWWPTSAKGALPTHTTYSYAPVENNEGITAMEPSEVISAPPAGVTCGTKVEELKTGCRALTFSYATQTTANGENRSEWGDYKGQLKQVIFHAYNPTAKAMEEKAVAQYSYDKQGRLRAEWDPRISPTLKTSYGYDAEGHVTSLTPPGQESWGFVYGTIAGDPNAGRALKVTRAPSSAGLWAGEAPNNTEAPEVSGTPMVGVRLAVSNGAWSNEPVVYGYQWEDCNAEGKSCTPIIGANNPNYTLTSSDIGHAIVAVVSAVNGGGTVSAASEPVAAVQTSPPGTRSSFTQLVDSGNSINAVSCIPGTTDCVISDSAGKAKYSTSVSTGSSANWKTWAGPSGQSPSQALACASTSMCLMADGKESAGGKLYYATSLGGSWSEAYTPVYGVDAIYCSSSSFCIDGQDNYGYFRYSTNPASTSWTLREQGELAGAIKSVFCLSSSFCAIGDGTGSVHVATTTAQVESWSWTHTKVDGTKALNGIACTSTTSCVAVDSAGYVLNLTISGNGSATVTKQNIAGNAGLTAVSCAGSTCVTVDNAGEVFVSKNAGASWVKQYGLSENLTSVSCASPSLCVTASTAGKVTALNPSFIQSMDGGTSINAVSCIPGTTDCVVSDSAGKALYATNVSTSSSATWNTWAGPSGQSPSHALACPSTSLCLLSDGKEAAGGTLYYATSLGGSWSEAESPSWGVDAISCASSSFCVEGQDNYGYFRYSTNPASTSWPREEQGNAAMKAVFCLSSSFCAIGDAAGSVHVATTTAQIESSSWTSTNVDGSTALNGIACTSTTSCVAVDGHGNVLNLTISGSGSATVSSHNIDGNVSLNAVACTAGSTCVTVDNVGNVFVSRDSGSSWTKEYALGDNLTSVSCASASLCVAGDTTGNVIAFGPVVLSEGEARPPQPGATIEYRVPVTGASAPYNMSAEEVEKWGQKNKGAFEKNDPVEATAVFFPDEPQGWPASSYKRATVTYMNEKGLTVNTAAPTGGIATTEYNELNEVTRTLSADNRATAMKEGCESVIEHKCKSAEAAEKLDTKTEYASEGQQIAKITGPEHLVKLTSGGAWVSARSVTHNYYNEGAKAAEEKNKETYNLLTKSTEGALLGNGTEEAKREAVTSYDGQEDLGWKLRKPTAVTTDPSGLNLTTTTVYDSATGAVVETKQPGAAAATADMTFKLKFGSHGSGQGQFQNDQGVAVDPNTGNVYVADYGLNRVEELTASGTFVAWVGSETSGSGEGQLSHPESVAVSSAGNVYVGDAGNHRVEEFDSTGHYVRAFGTEGVGTGQFGSTIYGMAFDGNGKLWVADGSNHRVQRFSATGSYEKQYGTQGTSEGKLEEPRGIAVSGSGVYVVDAVNNRVLQLTLEGTFVSQFGKSGWENGQVREPWGIAADAKGDLFVAEKGAGMIEEFNAQGRFVAWLGSPGSSEDQFEHPAGLALNASSGALYVADEGNSRIDEWTPGNAAAHATRTIYYSTAANAEFTACGERPEWAGLLCKRLPKNQPESKGPPLPEITVAAYNIWDEPEKTEEKFGSTTRTRKETYDAAGRAQLSEVTASPATDRAIASTTVVYNEETGAIAADVAYIEGKLKATTSKYNKLGQLSEYTDAEGNVAKYTYEAGGDNRLREESEGKGEEAQSTQTYSYNGTTGLVETLTDSAAGTFTASYDAEGKIKSEVYPNGMCANSVYNAVGEMVSIQYLKTRNCSEENAPLWYYDVIFPSIHGETTSNFSTLATENSAYDNAGRLLQTQEQPAGQGCTTRLYAYDEEGNRTSRIEREPATGGACAGEGSANQQGVHTQSYDTANRVTDSGVEYDLFGNATKLPAADAGGNELASTFYVDNQVYTQKQNGETLTYLYDPAGRTMETASAGKTTAKVISHYAGPGEAPAWTSEGSGNWTRNIAGLEGALAATQKNGQQPVLQLHDLSGNVVATASLSESETKLLSTYNSTEFGVPQPGTTPPAHAWLGAFGLATEPSMGAGVATQGGASYVPQLARAVQTAPVVPPGAFPNGAPGTEYTAAVSPSEYKFAEEEAARIWEQTEAERQRTKEREAAEQLQQCEEEGGCGLGEGESEDPIHYLNRKESEEVGTKLNNVGTWAELWDTVFAVVGFMFAGPEEFIEGEVASLIVGTAEPIDWYHKLGKKLIKCSGNKDGFPYCRLHWKQRHVTVPYLGTIAEWPDFGYTPAVKECNMGFSSIATLCLPLG